MIELSLLKVGWAGCILQQFARILLEVFVLTSGWKCAFCNGSLGLCLNC